MGMYTALHYAAELKSDVQQEVIDVLNYMLAGDKPQQPSLPDHPLFTTARWEWMLLCDSYYFDADTHSTLRYDDIANSYYLTIQCNLKNYDDEIEKFCDWIKPYIDKEPGDFLGYSRYEEAETPTLIYY